MRSGPKRTHVGGRQIHRVSRPLALSARGRGGGEQRIDCPTIRVEKPVGAGGKPPIRNPLVRRRSRTEDKCGASSRGSFTCIINGLHYRASLLQRLAPCRQRQAQKS